MAEENPLDQIKGRTFSMFEENGKGRILWNVFRGTISFTIMENGSRVENKPIWDETRVALLDTFNGILQGKSTGVTITASKKKSRESRERVTDYVMSIGLTEKRTIYFDVNLGSGNRRFNLGRVTNIQVGTDKMTDADQSQIRASVFIDWLTNIAPIEMVMTSRKFEKKDGGSGGGWGKSNNDSDNAFG